jgi:spermidine synthase
MSALIFVEDPTDAQIRQITQLYRQEGWWHLNTDDPDLVRGIIRGSHCFLLALEDKLVTGMGRAISDGVSDAYIQDVAVLDTHKGRGIGSKIVAQLTERLLADGLNWIGLIAERGGHGFYKRLGFETMPNATPMLILKK